MCTLEAISDDRREKAVIVRQGGGVGMILVDPLINNVGFQFVIPGTLIGQEEAKELQMYIKTSKLVFILYLFKYLSLYKNKSSQLNARKSTFEY